MKKQNLVYITLIILLCNCQSKLKSNNQFHPMVDGKNEEYQKLGVDPIKLSDDVNLYIFQNESFVWISYDYPKGSYGTLDMIIMSEKLKSALNIHVSTQLGEWYVNDNNSAPKSPTSDLWWNMNGWTANNIWVNGIDTISFDTPEFKLKNAEMRELQLDKVRFGKGEWKIKLKINSIIDRNGDFYSLSYPADESFLSIIAE